MATIQNPGRAFALPTGHIVPRLGTLTVGNDVLRCTDNAPMINGLAKSGQIVVTYDAEVDEVGDTIPAATIEPIPEAKAQAEVEAHLALSAADNLEPEAIPAKKK